MAFYTDTVASAPRTGFFAAIESFFTSIAVARELSLNVQGRVAKMDELRAKTDEELAALGMTRDTIELHVFRDLYYI
jgi:hypothetical protein